MAVCAVVAEVLEGSHQRRDALFEDAGVPGPPPDLPHHLKWKTWLRRAGNDTSVDSLAVLGRLIEEFMDLPPLPTLPTELSFGIGHDPVAEYSNKRTRLIAVLEQHGFRYFSGGRVIPNAVAPPDSTPITSTPNTTAQPSSIEELLQTLLRGLPREECEEIGSLRWHFRWFRPSGLSTRWRCCELPASGRVRLRPEPETHRK